MGKTPCIICKIVGLVLVVGAVNWGLIGLFKYDLVTTLFGDMTTVTRVIFAVVGVAGLLKLITVFKPCPCTKGT